MDDHEQLPDIIVQHRVNHETGKLERRELTREEWFDLSTKKAEDNARRIKAFIVEKYGEWRIPSVQDWGDFKRKEKEERRERSGDHSE